MAVFPFRGALFQLWIYCVAAQRGSRGMMFLLGVFVGALSIFGFLLMIGDLEWETTYYIPHEEFIKLLDEDYHLPKKDYK
jgi:hypothetical protein